MPSLWDKFYDFASGKALWNAGPGKLPSAIEDVFGKEQYLTPQQAAAQGYNPQGVKIPDPAPTTSISPSPSTTSSTQDPQTGYPALINPLAVNAFFASAIAPMLQQTLQGLGERNAGLAQQAQANLNQSQMPAQYRALFQQQIPRMQSEQNDLMAALGAAAITAPSLDLFMNQVNAARQQAAQSYMKQLYNEQTGSAGGALSTLSSLGVNIPGVTTPTPNATQPQPTQTTGG